jgi:hypothetical protein
MTDTGMNLDAANALRAKLFKLLTGDATPQRAFLSFVPGGLAVSDYTLRFLKDPQYVDQAYSFARVANSVPIGFGDWVQSATVMSEIYMDWLDRYLPPPFSLTKEEEKKLRQAEKFVEENFEKYIELKSKFNTAHTVWYALKVMPVDDRPSDYITLLSEAKNAMDIAEMRWKITGKRAQFDTEEAIVSDFSERDPVNTKQRLKNQFGEPATSSQGSFYPTTIYPPSLLDSGFEWGKYSFFHNEIREYSKEQSYRWGGSAGYDALLWSVKAEHEGRKEFNQYETDISNVLVEFEMLRAPITRAWFSNFLLSGRGWKWATSTPEDPSGGDPMSDGLIPPREGNWVMIPTEAILARNLTVKLDMSSSVNKESLLETKTSTEVGLGPFQVKGNVETSEGETSFDFVEEGDGIASAQPQIIAFLCELMPLEPNPNWALWEEAPALAGVG